MTNSTSFQDSLKSTQDLLVASVTKAEAALNKARATSEELQGILEGIRALNVPFPISGLEPGHLNNSAPTLKFEGLMRSSVLQLFELFPGVAVVMISGGCTSFVPEEIQKAEPHLTVTPIAPLVYRLDTWGKDLREEYYWWTKIAGKLVKICVTNESISQCVAKVKVVRTFLSKETEKAHFTYSDLPGGMLLQWYSSCRATPPLSAHFQDGVDWQKQFLESKPFSCQVSYDPCTC